MMQVKETSLVKASFWVDLFLLLALGHEGHTHNEKGVDTFIGISDTI